MGLSSSPNALSWLGPLSGVQTAQPATWVLPEKPAYLRGHPEYGPVLIPKVLAESGPPGCIERAGPADPNHLKEAGVRQVHPGKLRCGQERDG